MKRTIILLFIGLSVNSYGQNEIIDEFDNGVVDPLMYQSINSTLTVTQIGQDSNFLEVDLKRYKSYI